MGGHSSLQYVHERQLRNPRFGPWGVRAMQDPWWDYRLDCLLSVCCLQRDWAGISLLFSWWARQLNASVHLICITDRDIWDLRFWSRGSGHRRLPLEGPHCVISSEVLLWSTFHYENWKIKGHMVEIHDQGNRWLLTEILPLRITKGYNVHASSVSAALLTRL